MTVATDIVAHHLRLFGLRDGTSNESSGGLLLIEKPGADRVSEARHFASTGGLVIALLPAENFCQALSVSLDAGAVPAPAELQYVQGRGSPWGRLRSLHAAHVFRGSGLRPLVCRSDGAAVWAQVELGKGNVILVGTDLAGDLTRYRQGDPEKEKARHTSPVWGYAGERPLYLFEADRAGEDPSERHADWWGVAIATTACTLLGARLAPLLPGAAPGAIVITGDDDQAYLEKYSEQMRLLGDVPLTYFLHPQTRHTKKTLRVMFDRKRIDLGIHPDALTEPQRYASVLKEQVTWYRSLTGDGPLSVRNHGFLNDGYWGHLPAWREHGIRISSNIPGLNGRVLNGSLLPGRIALATGLTEHWSILTAIGDGVRSIESLSDKAAGELILRMADAIRSSAVPGVIVLNLHPQNVSDTREMHLAALRVIRDGFVAWTMRDCLRWFEERDKPAAVRI